MTAQRRIPGEPGVWVLLFGDMGIFAILFGVFAVYRDRAPGAFTRAQTHLHGVFGLANTLLLVSGSLGVALAVRWIRAAAGEPGYDGAPRRARIALIIAVLCAAGFLSDKGIEWASLLSAGHHPSGNGFYTYFFVLTGLHALHLMVATAVVVGILLVTRQGELTRAKRIFLEGGACFWHVVDFVWIVLFALLYLAH